MDVRVDTRGASLQTHADDRTGFRLACSPSNISDSALLPHVFDVPSIHSVNLREVVEGYFTMGTDDAQAAPEARPAHRVWLDTFFMSAAEVTVAEFRKFVALTNNTPSSACRTVAGSETGSFIQPGFEQEEDHPVVCVSWEDAVAFSAWANDLVGDYWHCSLPTEAQWEKAARGTLKAEEECKKEWLQNSDPWYAPPQPTTLLSNLSAQQEINLILHAPYKTVVANEQEAKHIPGLRVSSSSSSETLASDGKMIVVNVSWIAKQRITLLWQHARTTFWDGSMPNHILNVTGTISAINEAFLTLTYTSRAGFSGEDQINVIARDCSIVIENKAPPAQPIKVYEAIVSLIVVEQYDKPTLQVLRKTIYTMENQEVFSQTHSASAKEMPKCLSSPLLRALALQDRAQ